jgi:hypothetical protein
MKKNFYVFPPALSGVDFAVLIDCPSCLVNTQSEYVCVERGPGDFKAANGE